MAETQHTVSHWSIGRGRGSRPAQPYKPSRRPGQPASPSSAQSPASDPVGDVQTDLSKCSIDSSSNASAGSNANYASRSRATPGNGTASFAKTEGANGMPDASAMKGGVTKLKAKYSYKANAESPLGQKELAVRQGQEVVFLETCQDNEMWWKVKSQEGDGDGEEGFVPASYVEVSSQKVTQLPWLAAKQTSEAAALPTVKPKWKPYVSAYNREGNVAQGGANANKEQYYCKWCDKQLNGPKPYGAHMTSKAHKEEVDLAKEDGIYTED